VFCMSIGRKRRDAGIIVRAAEYHKMGMDWGVDKETEGYFHIWMLRREPVAIDWYKETSFLVGRKGVGANCEALVPLQWPMC